VGNECDSVSGDRRERQNGTSRSIKTQLSACMTAQRTILSRHDRVHGKPHSTRVEYAIKSPETHNMLSQGSLTRKQREHQRSPWWQLHPRHQRQPWQQPSWGQGQRRREQQQPWERRQERKLQHSPPSWEHPNGSTTSSVTNCTNASNTLKKSPLHDTDTDKTNEMYESFIMVNDPIHREM
jgi:hypothetical protein